MGEALSDAVVGTIAWVGVTFLPILAAVGAWNLAARLRSGWVVHVLLPPCLLACEWGLVRVLFRALHDHGDGPPGLGFALIPALVILALTAARKMG